MTIATRNLTAQGIALAVTGAPRVEQHIHICLRRHGPAGTRFIVLVDGEYYEVGRHALGALQNGMTPADLELEPIEDEPSEIDPFDGDYSSADHFPALYRSGRA